MLLLAIVTVAPGDDGLALDPRSAQPDGTAAVLAVAQQLGVATTVADAPEDLAARAPASGSAADVVLILRDPGNEEWSAAFDRALQRGATVVVTDPSSPLAPDPTQGFVAPSPSPECALDALNDVTVVTGTGFVGLEVTNGAVGCFPVDAQAAWLVAEQRGDGALVSTGGAGFLTNAALDDADNGVLAASLLAPATAGSLTVVGPQIALAVAGGEASLIDLIPDRVKLALLQLLVALVVVVAWRWRRLGAPVVEPLPVQLQGSDLVAATGELLDQAGGYRHAADMLADSLRHDLALRCGLGPGATARQVATAAEPTVGISREEVESLLEPEGLDGPEAFVAHTRRIAQVRIRAGLSGDRASGHAATVAADTPGDDAADMHRLTDQEMTHDA